jgi:hypothetical protein
VTSELVVILDANVLADSAVSDLFLRLAEEPRFLSIRWTNEIWEETYRTLIQKLGWPERLAASRVQAAKQAFPEALVEGYADLIGQCTNDAKDRHILAAAIRADAESIVTFNVRHFVPADLEPWNVKAVHPSDCLNNLFELDKVLVLSTLHLMAERRNKTFVEMLSRLSAPTPTFTSRVAADLKLEVPAYLPSSWRT